MRNKGRGPCRKICVNGEQTGSHIRIGFSRNCHAPEDCRDSGVARIAATLEHDSGSQG
jgi:hypothetical protein